MHVYGYDGRRGGGLTWEFQAIVPGDPILSGEELVFVKHGIRGRQNVRDFEESVKGGETLLRGVMAVGLIGSKDHGVEDASKRKKDTSTVTLKSLMKKRGHFMTTLRRVRFE